MGEKAISMSPQVSVIIPVYNAARYIGRCSESLFGQSLQSIEFVFVDDASTDGSILVVLQTLMRYPNRKDQVRFLTMDSHRGTGAVRQLGLETVTGEYIIHCDSDDWVESTMYEQLYRKAKESKSDIVTCGYIVESFDNKKYRQESALSPNNSTTLFSISPQTGSLCFKLIRRQFIIDNQIQIPEDISWGEDLCFSLKALILSSKTECIESPLYHYVQQPDSLTHGITASLCQDLLKCGIVIEAFLKEKNLLQLYKFQLNWLKFQLKQYLLIYPETRSFSLWCKTYPESHKNVWGYSSPFYLKVISWFIAHGQYFLAERLLTIKDGLCRR